MKAATTIVVATLWCASAFGLNGVTGSKVLKNSVVIASRKPMVQAVDIQGQRLSNMVSFGLFDLLLSEVLFMASKALERLHNIECRRPCRCRSLIEDFKIPFQRF